MTIDVDPTLRKLDPTPEFLGAPIWRAPERAVLTQAVEKFGFYPDPAEAKMILTLKDREGEQLDGRRYLNRGALGIKDRSHLGNMVPESFVRFTLQEKYDELQAFAGRAADNVTYSGSVLRHLEPINRQAKVPFKDLYLAELIHERNKEGIQARAEAFSVAKFFEKYQFADGRIDEMLELSEHPTPVEIQEYIIEILGILNSQTLRNLVETMYVASNNQEEYWNAVVSQAGEHPYVVDKSKPKPRDDEAEAFLSELQ